MSGCICASSCRWFSGDLRKIAFSCKWGRKRQETEITEQISAFALILTSFLSSWWKQPVWKKSMRISTTLCIFKCFAVHFIHMIQNSQTWGSTEGNVTNYRERFFLSPSLSKKEWYICLENLNLRHFAQILTKIWTLCIWGNNSGSNQAERKPKSCATLNRNNKNTKLERYNFIACFSPTNIY